MLKNSVASYLEVRRAGGYKLVDDEIYLYSFAKFAAAQGDAYIVAKTAIAWAQQSNSEPQRATRLKSVRRFAYFSYAADNRHEIPPKDVFLARRPRPTPYLYSEDEVQALMKQTDRLRPPGSFRPMMYGILIGLLAATGLRISEALNLRFHDITADGLVIRETKFHKSRLVPLHASVITALDKYLIKRYEFVTNDDHFFISQQGKPLTYDSVNQTFLRLIKAAGLPRQPNQPRPRLIDFRHTFASNALAACPNDRNHVGNHTLALMTYLGHAKPSSTYWYLESTPHLMNDITQSCEHWIEENTL